MREGQQLAGVLNYYSRLTPRLSILLNPLYKEIKMGNKFKLNRAIEMGIQRVKELVRDGLGVHHLDYSNMQDSCIFVCCDSSLNTAVYCIGNCK